MFRRFQADIVASEYNFSAFGIGGGVEVYTVLEDGRGLISVTGGFDVGAPGFDFGVKSIDIYDGYSVDDLIGGGFYVEAIPGGGRGYMYNRQQIVIGEYIAVRSDLSVGAGGAVTFYTTDLLGIVAAARHIAAQGLVPFADALVAAENMVRELYDLPCFPSGTSITTGSCTIDKIEAIELGDQVCVLNTSSYGTVTQIFRNITTEWLEVVWTHPETGSIEQIISTPGHRFLKPDASYDRIVDMVDRSVVVADAANDNHDENDSSFGGAHPFSAGAERPFGVGPDEQIVSDAWVAHQPSLSFINEVV